MFDTQLKNCIFCIKLRKYISLKLFEYNFFGKNLILNFLLDPDLPKMKFLWYQKSEHETFVISCMSLLWHKELKLT